MNSNAETCFSTSTLSGSSGAARASASAERGYTIIEVMIAIAIFSIGILAQVCQKFSRGADFGAKLACAAR